MQLGGLVGRARRTGSVLTEEQIASLTPGQRARYTTILTGLVPPGLQVPPVIDLPGIPTGGGRDVAAPAGTSGADAGASGGSGDSGGGILGGVGDFFSNIPTQVWYVVGGVVLLLMLKKR